jgi:hypothetical protein
LGKDNLVQTTKVGRTVFYQLTEEGLQRLVTLSPHPAFAKQVVGQVTPERLREQQAVLLLHLLESPNQRLTKVEANRKLTDRVRQALDLSPRVADIRRRELSQRNFIEVIKEKRFESYQLAPDGRDYLGTVEKLPDIEFRLKGGVLSQLLAAVRATAESFRATQRPVQAPPEDLKRAVYEEFQELLREKYSFGGLVPIHEIRIPSVGETLFYLETAHAQPVPG